MRAFVSWSGGKDAALACRRALDDPRLTVVGLLNMTEEDGVHSRTHGVPTELLRLQGRLLGLPLWQQPASWENYEQRFKAVVARLKAEHGVSAGVFGDIDLLPHREWIERVCGECGITPFLPLWGEERESLLREFRATGFSALIVAVRADVLDRTWPGRALDEAAVRELRAMKSIDLCGEAGEFHTVVTAAPYFRGRIAIEPGPVYGRDGHWLLEIAGFSGIEAGAERGG